MKPYVNEGRMPLEPIRWWGRTFIGLDAKKQQERVIHLRLPSWGFGYCVNVDDERWGQRVLMYRGRSGFSMQWYFPPTSEEVMRSYRIVPDAEPTAKDIMYGGAPEPWWRRWFWWDAS